MSENRNRHRQNLQSFFRLFPLTLFHLEGCPCEELAEDLHDVHGDVHRLVVVDDDHLAVVLVDVLVVLDDAVAAQQEPLKAKKKIINCQTKNFRPRLTCCC